MGGTYQQALNTPPNASVGRLQPLKQKTKLDSKLTLFQNMYNLQD